MSLVIELLNSIIVVLFWEW